MRPDKSRTVPKPRGRLEGVRQVEASGIPEPPPSLHCLVLLRPLAGGGQLRLVLHLYFGVSERVPEPPPSHHGECRP